MSREDARMSMTLDPDLKRRFKAVADANKRSMIQEMTIAITEHVEAFERGGVNRDLNSGLDIADDKLRDTIRSVVEEMLEEKKRGAKHD